MEEALQQRYDYPEYPLHKQEHEGSIRDFTKLENQFDAEGATLSLVIQTNQTMVDWLIRHIKAPTRNWRLSCAR